MSIYTSTITAFLEWLYGDEALLKSPCGTVYPVTVKSCTLVNPEDVLLDLIPDSRQFPATSWLLEELKQQNSHLWNGRTYVFRELDSASSWPRLLCSTGYYFDTVNTCLILTEELKRTIAAVRETDFASLYEAMSVRRGIHANQTGKAALEDVWTGANRSAAISISCLFAVYDGVSYRYYVRRRSSKLADDAGLFHVIPSMVFQPVAKEGQERDDFNITNTILRELAEELFDYQDLTATDVNVKSDSWAPYPEIVALQELLQKGEAELVIAGVAMDLFNLRPEIIAVLVVHSADWLKQYQSQIRFSTSEYVSDADSESAADGYESYRDIDDDSVFQPDGEFSPANGVPVGAACLILGLPIARQLRDRYRNFTSPSSNQ